MRQIRPATITQLYADAYFFKSINFFMGPPSRENAAAQCLTNGKQHVRTYFRVDLRAVMHYLGRL